MTLGGSRLWEISIEVRASLDVQAVEVGKQEPVWAGLGARGNKVSAL